MLRLFSLGGAGRAVENKPRGRSSATFSRLIFIGGGGGGGGGGRCCDLWGEGEELGFCSDVSYDLNH